MRKGRSARLRRACIDNASAAARPADLVLASAWERLLAMTMDWLLILVASFLLLHAQMAQLVDRLQAVMTTAQALGPTAEQNAFVNFEQNPATISALVSYFLMVFLMALAYFWALEARGGATLGKRVLGLRVVNLPEQTPAGIWSTGVPHDLVPDRAGRFRLRRRLGAVHHQPARRGAVVRRLGGARHRPAEALAA